MPDERYVFDPETWDRLDQSRIPVISVLHVLYRSRVVRRHIGAVLQLAGQDQAGQWLAVAAVETLDDQYLIVGARWLDDDEIEHIRKTGGQG